MTITSLSAQVWAAAHHKVTLMWYPHIFSRVCQNLLQLYCILIEIILTCQYLYALCLKKKTKAKINALHHQLSQVVHWSVVLSGICPWLVSVLSLVISRVDPTWCHGWESKLHVFKFDSQLCETGTERGAWGLHFYMFESPMPVIYMCTRKRYLRETCVPSWWNLHPKMPETGTLTDVSAVGLAFAGVHLGHCYLVKPM